MKSVLPAAAAVIWFLTCALGGVVPVEPVSVPSIAAANGFGTLAMNQDVFTGFDLDQVGDDAPHMWYNGSWFAGSAPSGNPYGRVPAQYISFNNAGGYIDIDWNISMAVGCQATGSGCPTPQIATASNDMTVSRAFGHGYYECRAAIVNYSPGGYSACYLLGVTMGVDCLAAGFDGYNTKAIANPPGYSELDWQQVFGNISPGGTNGANYAAMHGGGTDCGGGDGSILPATPTRPWAPPGGTDFSQIHAYGILWCGASSGGSVCNGTPQVCFYFDGTLEYCADTTSTNEDQLATIQMFELEACGGAGLDDLNTSSCLGGVTDIHNQVYSIRYWSCAAWQGNALAC